MNTLSREERRIIEEKGTEKPFTGEFLDINIKGSYLCRKCSTQLFRSENKFNSQCGWISFDEGTVHETPDGNRTEITCSTCGGHLGHVFRGERFTEKNTRHCVNSLSVIFQPDEGYPQKAYFAGGCFWGVEYYMKQIPGVYTVVSGFSGGDVPDPSYEEVVRGNTGHVETVEVYYDGEEVSFEALAKQFLEIHDPEQERRQGPDIGEQYSSVIFYSTEEERDTIYALLNELREKGYNPVTRVEPYREFFRAEDYHQNYYNRTGKFPYCHSRVKRFSPG